MSDYNASSFDTNEYNDQIWTPPGSSQSSQTTKSSFDYTNAFVPQVSNYPVSILPRVALGHALFAQGYMCVMIDTILSIHSPATSPETTISSRMSDTVLPMHTALSLPTQTPALETSTYRPLAPRCQANTSTTRLTTQVRGHSTLAGKHMAPIPIRSPKPPQPRVSFVPVVRSALFVTDRLKDPSG